MLTQTGHDPDHPAVARAVAYLRKEQEPDGAWFGRWGTNYIYGTWSVLVALNAASEDMQAPYIQRAVDWLTAHQQADGGWGESCASYWKERKDDVVASVPSQTAWALLALMAAGETESDTVRRGIDYLRHAIARVGCGRSDPITRLVFPKYSIFIITAIVVIFHSGRSPAIPI